VLAGEDRLFVSFADNVGDQEFLGGGAARGDAGSADVAHLAADDVSSLLVESFAADSKEIIVMWIKDFQLALTELT